MFWLQVLVALGIILATVLVAGGRGDSLDGVPVQRAPQRLPLDRPVVASDVVGLRLGVTLRGYRMDEVDDALDKLAEELASRDAHIAELEHASTSRGAAIVPTAAGAAVHAPEPASGPGAEPAPATAGGADAERPPSA